MQRQAVDLFSFRGKGVRKTGPTKFVMETEDFTPERQLDVLFLVAGEDSALTNKKAQ